MTSFISFTAIYTFRLKSTYSFVALLREEFWITVLKHQFHLHPDCKKYHWHVKYGEYPFTLVLAFELCLDLGNLYEQELLVVSIKR